ncbi:hypothetical protein P3875_00165 [Myroides sp. JBRI-B21084]|uniref:hypothetical protein n=1 Tax=Myroides sp. JBRI-B21084 TaxID=3119977 RepID=UPI0026E3B19B|nr:hypothetical protein [Paenimyroides cloacae]WKW46529.1 hypothetical protein P3875_00165 [Paenimyroides cloacae]
MIITGTIDQVFPRFYYKDGKKINYYELLVSYNFYNGINQILLLAKDFDHRNSNNKEQLYSFNFDIASKYVNGKLTTDFYLQSYKKIANDSENKLIVIRTYFEKIDFEVLKKEEVKNRKKVFGKFTSIHKNQPALYCYFWEDNHFLVDINKVSKIQLNCRSLPYKDKYISNVEVWRTMENDNFLGSII